MTDTLHRILLAAAVAALASGCRDNNDNGADDGTTDHTTPTPVESGEFTYSLDEGIDGLPLWTTPTAHRVTVGDRPPATTASGLQLHAARGEFEPVQLVIGPVSGTARVTVVPFPTLGDQQELNLSVASPVDDISETLTPVSSGDTVELSANRGVPVWLTVRVPGDAPAGAHATTLTVEKDGTAVEVPVSLTVFDFSLPQEIHFASQLNLSISGLMGSGRSEEDAKTMLFEHRMTPASVPWPSGYSYNITWDSAANPQRCETFYTEPDEGAEYSVGTLGPKYILGDGWNGVGFPDSMLFQFVDNSTPRPDTFCGESRGDHHGTAAYNEAWGNWLAALEGYLADNGMLDRTYWYVQNEPQNAQDEALAAHLCRLSRAAAPGLRIAVSEEPKPAIAEDPDGPCGYDIWIAHVRAYEETYAWERQRSAGEAVWFYSLDHDPDPYFNPAVSDASGMDARIIPWAAWSHRIVGWAYYDAGRFFDGSGNPGVRAELLREGFEDYEYLWLANGGAHPGVDDTLPVDATVRSVAAGMTSWTKDPDAFMALRRELGFYIEGTRDALPLLTVTSDRPAGNYYINFQDPEGEPFDDPLIVDGNEYIKVGWAAFDSDAGYGWSGENMGTDILMTGWSTDESFNVIERSYIYDDYRRDNLFEFELSPGTYAVTVGVGMAGRAYEGQPHNVTIEGIPVVDDEPTLPDATVIARSATIPITDGALSMVVAGRSASIGDYSYTFLDYLQIELVE